MTKKRTGKQVYMVCPNLGCQIPNVNGLKKCPICETWLVIPKQRRGGDKRNGRRKFHFSSYGRER